jgi:hypothetical protein
MGTTPIRAVGEKPVRTNERELTACAEQMAVETKEVPAVTHRRIDSGILSTPTLRER